MYRYLEIKQQLREMVEQAVFGDRLPDRLTLCRILDTSRATIDKAIAELTREGLLVSHKGSGTFVAPMMTGSNWSGCSWALVVPNITNDIYRSLLTAVEKSASEKNINLQICSSDNDFIKQERHIRQLNDSGISGMLIVPLITDTPAENYRLYAGLSALTIPFVFCNRAVDGINAPLITSDNHYGGYMATRHLIDRGYRRIAYICHRHVRNCIERCQGYICALMEAGIGIDRQLIRMPKPNEKELNYYQEAEFLLKNTDVDAFFSFSDGGALRIAAAVADAGRRLSEEIGLIGYGDDVGGREMTPPLTTVSYRIVDIGRMAADVLYKLCENQEIVSGFQDYLFKPELIIRDTCAGRKKVKKRRADGNG